MNRPDPQSSKPRQLPFTEEQILRWVDAWRARTGRWPQLKSGRVTRGRSATWALVDMALRFGRHGLPGGSSLAQLLAQQRGVRNLGRLPPLTEQQILGWADQFRRRNRAWPYVTSEPIAATAENWRRVDWALRFGRRGLPGGSSLARLLATHRGVRSTGHFVSLCVGDILRWADQHYQRTGGWPKDHSGAIPDAPGESWKNVNQALYVGLRGLPGGGSLARLLEAERNKPKHSDRPFLAEGLILSWMQAHRRRTGRWPCRNSGPVVDAPGEQWANLDEALRRGSRGLPGRSSLRQLRAVGGSSGRRLGPARRVAAPR